MGKETITKVVKTEIKTKDGTVITIDGSEEEVKRLLTSISLAKNESKEASSKQRKEHTENKKASISVFLNDLKEEGFFDKPKGLSEVRDALAERGRIYATTTLSPKVLSQVKKRNLGRIKEENKWKYVTR